ncbi:MAG: hypothetical protein KatS3mg111_0481 [Pirellulaceae bacterium]|nr:MAG: hypothetical protein KatS3mg111_0481 [Pirellulaceae bacterium]
MRVGSVLQFGATHPLVCRKCFYDKKLRTMSWHHGATACCLCATVGRLAELGDRLSEWESHAT